ncbi:MAG: hypothetical protein WDN72_04485 [Alphaproteobacteria bacterium]
MRVTVIDEKTGEIHAVERSRTPSAAQPLIIDSETGPLEFHLAPAAEQPGWKPVTFRDGRVIEVDPDSGEIAGRG